VQAAIIIWFRWLVWASHAPHLKIFEVLNSDKLAVHLIKPISIFIDYQNLEKILFPNYDDLIILCYAGPHEKPHRQ